MGPSRKFCGGRVAVHDAVWQGSGSARAAAEATTNQLTHVGTCCGLGAFVFLVNGIELTFECCMHMHEQHLGWGGVIVRQFSRFFLAGKDLQGVVWGLCCF